MKNFYIVLCFIFITFIIVIVSYLFITNYNDIQDVKLIRCIDGDTAWFNVNGKKEKVRFLGIDTPEFTNMQEEYGKEASEYTCNMLINAKDIYLEYDSNSDRYDKYNRLLAWVFVDNNNLSELLLSNGYAEVNYIYGNYKYIDNLCISQKKAYQGKLGIWSIRYSDYDNNYCFKNNY